MPKQARRKDSVIVSFLIDRATLAEIDARCKRSDTHFKEPLNRSSWIKRAIRRDLAHAKRSGGKRKAKDLATAEGGQS